MTDNLNSEQLDQLNKANQKIKKCSEKVAKARQEFIEAGTFMSSPEVANAQSQIQKQVDQIKKVLNGQTSEDMKKALAEQVQSQLLYEQKMEEFCSLWTEEYLKKVKSGLPHFDHEVQSRLNHFLSEANEPRIETNKALLQVMQQEADSDTMELMTFNSEILTEEQQKAEQATRLQVLKKMEEAGEEVSGFDISLFQDPDLVAKEMDSVDSLTAAAETLKAAPDFEISPEIEEQMKPLQEASVLYMEKLAEGDQRIMSAEKKLLLAEKALLEARDAYKTLKQSFI
ncbi:MAG: hypothetical protein CSA81_07010 [Acidobacteria bacterium]|nr:MAG: hypothetical protein CSA81_07010 [Acidobacteriota bacterium]